MTLARNQSFTYEKYLSILTSPFNMKYWWKIFKKFLNTEQPTELQQGLPNCRVSPEERPEVTTSQDTAEGSQTNVCRAILTGFSTGSRFGLVYLVCLGPSILLFTIGTPLNKTLMLVSSKKIDKFFENNYPGKKSSTMYFLMHLAYVTLLILLIFVAFSFGSGFVNLMLYLVTGLYLNGSFYSPYVVPISILLIYSWRNWRSFVETKYLLLKTIIYEICEEYHEKEIAKEHRDNTIEVSNKNCIVDVKKGTVSKALYHKITQNILPYHQVLFNFFVQMFFVISICLIVFVMMLLGQTSNIEVPVQIMSTIAVSTFPLIFDTIWTDHSSEQKDVNRKKLKQDLKEIMKMEMKTDYIVTVQLTLEEKPSIFDLLESRSGVFS